MSQLIVSRRAVDDLEMIADYIGQRNPNAAERVLEALHQSFQTLCRLPRAGLQLNRIRLGLRAFPAQRPADQYVIFFVFREADDVVEIETVIHGARDWELIFEQRE